MAFKMKDSPFHNNGGKGKRGRRQKQPDSKEMSTDYNFMKQQFENFNPQTDTIFSSVGVKYDGGAMALGGTRREARRQNYNYFYRRCANAEKRKSLIC